jgi:hypothetical protein
MYTWFMDYEKALRIVLTISYEKRVWVFTAASMKMTALWDTVRVVTLKL